MAGLGSAVGSGGLSATGMAGSAKVLMRIDQAMLALGVISMGVNENRWWLEEHYFGGFLLELDLLNSAAQIYGLARVAVSAPQLLRNLHESYKNARERRAALSEPFSPEQSDLLKKIDDQIQGIPDTPQSNKDTTTTPAVEENASRKTMSGPGSPTTAKKGTPPVARNAIADQLQDAMVYEAQHHLASRKAQPAPSELISGQRKPLFSAPDYGSTTIGKPHTSLEAARKVYDQVLVETAGKNEVGIWQHTETGEFIVRLGQTTEVTSPPGDSWRAVQHYHTNMPDIPLWRQPARADVAELGNRVSGEGRAMTEIVEGRLPNDRIGRTAYTVSPDERSRSNLLIQRANE